MLASRSDGEIAPTAQRDLRKPSFSEDCGAQPSPQGPWAPIRDRGAQRRGGRHLTDPGKDPRHPRPSNGGGEVMSAPYPDPPLMPGGRVCRAAAPRFFGTLMSPRGGGPWAEEGRK